MARILIDTWIRCSIKGWIFLSIGEDGYDVFARECCSGGTHVLA